MMKRVMWLGLGLMALLVLSVGVASADLGDRLLSLGNRGDDVVELQRNLSELGYPVPATGYFGSSTQRAVAAFQSQVGLRITGKADTATIKALQDQVTELRSLPEGEDNGSLLPYGEGYGPYATPFDRYQRGPTGPSDQGAYGRGFPMGPGIMEGMMGGMMRGGWNSGGNFGPGGDRASGGGFGPGMMGGGWNSGGNLGPGGDRGFGGGFGPGMMGGGWNSGGNLGPGGDRGFGGGFGPGMMGGGSGPGGGFGSGILGGLSGMARGLSGITGGFWGSNPFR